MHAIIGMVVPHPVLHSQGPVSSVVFLHCRASFLVIAGIAAAQTVASAWLYLRTRAAYKTEYMMLKKFAEEVHGDPEE